MYFRKFLRLKLGLNRCILFFRPVDLCRSPASGYQYAASRFACVLRAYLFASFVYLKLCYRRFQPVMVPEPTVDETYQILLGLRERYEAHHKLRYTDDSLDAAAKYSSQYISDRFLPDKAIDLIDEAGSRVRLRHAQLPEEAREFDKELKALLKEKDAAVRSAYILSVNHAALLWIRGFLASYLVSYIICGLHDLSHWSPPVGSHGYIVLSEAMLF